MKLFFRISLLLLVWSCSVRDNNKNSFALEEFNFSDKINTIVNAADDSIVFISQNHCDKCIKKAISIINPTTTVITHYSSKLRAERTLDGTGFTNFSEALFDKNPPISFNYPLLLVRGTAKHWNYYIVDDNFNLTK